MKLLNVIKEQANTEDGGGTGSPRGEDGGGAAHRTGGRRGRAPAARKRRRGAGHKKEMKGGRQGWRWRTATTAEMEGHGGRRW